MILEFRDITYTIPNGEVIYKNLNLEISQNEHFGVLGKNGIGKSTFIEMILGMRKPTKGQIKVFGENPLDPKRKLKHKTFALTHDLVIPGHIAVKDMIDFYKFFYPNYCQETQKEFISIFDIELNKKFGQLSTGQKIKSMLMTAFSAKATLYLFDEVTAVLDPNARNKFITYLKDYKAKHNCCVLLSTNITQDLEGIVENVIYLDEHKKVSIKNVEEVKTLFGLEA